MNDIRKNTKDGMVDIKIVGIGGGGNNVLNNLIEMGGENADFIALDTDAEKLASSLATHKILIGENFTCGDGTEKGSNRSARKFSKALNRTDKHISIYKSEQARAEGRMIKAQRKGNQKKYDKNKQYHDELSSRIQGLENTQKQTYHDAKEGAGMAVSSRARTRDVQAGRQFTRWFFLGLLPAAIGSGIDYHKYGKEGAGLVKGQKWDVYMPLDNESR